MEQAQVQYFLTLFSLLVGIAIIVPMGSKTIKEMIKKFKF